MKKIAILLMTLLLTTGCERSDLVVSFLKGHLVSSKISSASVSNVKIINNQLVITGSGLDAVSTIKITSDSTSKDFVVESKTATTIVANSSLASSLNLSKAFSLILSDANASATFPIDFSLCNAKIGSGEIDCATPSDGDVLAYDSSDQKWKPTSVPGVGSAVIGANGYAKLNLNETEPVTCDSSKVGSMAMNDRAVLCICKPGGVWESTDGSGQCKWNNSCPDVGLPAGAQAGDYLNCDCSAAQLASGSVIGGDNSDYVYSSSSSVCRAALHAGQTMYPPLNSIGFVVLNGRASYIGATSNGITSDAGPGTTLMFGWPTATAFHSRSGPAYITGL